MQHPNARLTPRAGTSSCCSSSVARRCDSRRRRATWRCRPHRWVVRWRAAATAERASLACLLDRSSRPHRSPRRLAEALQQRVVEARAQTGWGPRLLAGPLGLAHQTIWKVLRRHGCSRPARALREPANRYEWPCPGDLLHMDVSRSARFARPGHAVTGDRTSSNADRQRVDGYEYAHAIVDDHSRLAYVELHADERDTTVVAFTARALAWYRERGIGASRLMTDG
jgi:hypothetical protein